MLRALHSSAIARVSRSWNAFAKICTKDRQDNAIAAGRNVLLRSARTLVASNDPNHLIAAAGCEDLIIIHTNEATLVCWADYAERESRNCIIRSVMQFGKELL